MRKEEIEKASICQYQIIGTIGEQEAFKNGFVKGAEWADKTMIEKATQWLFENVYDYLNPEDQERVESFRRYMEE